MCIRLDQSLTPPPFHSPINRGGAWPPCAPCSYPSEPSSFSSYTIKKKLCPRKKLNRTFGWNWLKQFSYTVKKKKYDRIWSNSLVLPHITYCNIVWGNSNQSKLNSILILKKKALRICTRSNYLAHTNPIFHELKPLKLHDIHTYQTSISMFKHIRNLLPLFHDVFTHNRDIHSYPTRHSNDFHLNNPKQLLAHRSI